MTTPFVTKHINVITGGIIFSVSSSFVLAVVFMIMAFVKMNRIYVTAEITDSRLVVDAKDGKVNLYTAAFKLKNGDTKTIQMRQQIHTNGGKIHANGKFLMYYQDLEKIAQTLRFANSSDRVPSFILGSVFSSITFVAYMILTKKDEKF